MALAKRFARAICFASSLCILTAPTVFASANTKRASNVRREQAGPVSYWLDGTFSNKRVHVLQIDLTNKGIGFRASRSDERGLTPSEFSAKTGALAVINGDFFDGAKKTIGLAMGQGVVWPGTADTKEWSFLACDDDNDCFIEPYQKVTQPNSTWTSVIGGWQVLLDPDFAWMKANDVECGEFCLTEHPRTVIGLDADRSTMWWVMIEGRQGSLTGLSLADSTRILRNLGAEWALNLDGGGSSGLIMNGRRMNGRPFNEPLERKVANCLAIVARP